MLYGVLLAGCSPWFVIANEDQLQYSSCASCPTARKGPQHTSYYYCDSHWTDSRSPGSASPVCVFAAACIASRKHTPEIGQESMVKFVVYLVACPCQWAVFVDCLLRMLDAPGWSLESANSRVDLDRAVRW
ncbi:hypothetical protein BDV06DRAFT_189054 [Aspergillus oleicola]